MAQIIGMPKLGFDMAEGTLVRWVVNEGEQVTKGAVLAEIETDKATVEVEAEYSGVLLRQLVTQGTVVPVNDPIAVIGEAGETVDIDALLGKQPAGQIPAEEKKPAEGPAEIKATAPVEPPSIASGAVRASPLARSMAGELGIDVRLVKGTGPAGRVTKKDIEAYQARPAVSEVSKAPPAMRIPTLAPAPAFIRETRTVPLPKLRAAIGRRMTESMQQAPHFYVTHEYDVAALLERRKEINALLPEDDKLSVNDFIVRAAALSLLEFPNLNASLDLKNNAQVYHGEINVGVAVAMENGLLTVVNRNTDQKTVHQISSELKAMVGRAREGKVRSEDIEGSTFTVSNMGMYEVEQFTAIINPPEAAILAIGSAKQVPVVVNGEIKVGSRMKMTLSIDHRISDGVEGARFLQALAKYIEEPLRLLI
ncbi:MAG: dihydrolipoamide acyltransferase [Anaerolineales bacterium]|nr:2-oxo acid dehydrogenase subunit E2 [Anaerolineae bacterium]PWB53804.1 MAG: dihydrolipoamide acyltransferase [Anaerolineales bacterium]